MNKKLILSIILGVLITPAMSMNEINIQNFSNIRVANNIDKKDVWKNLSKEICANAPLDKLFTHGESLRIKMFSYLYSFMGFFEAKDNKIIANIILKIITGESKKQSYYQIDNTSSALQKLIDRKCKILDKESYTAYDCMTKEDLLQYITFIDEVSQMLIIKLTKIQNKIKSDIQINSNNKLRHKFCLFDMTKIDNWDNFYTWFNNIVNFCKGKNLFKNIFFSIKFKNKDNNYVDVNSEDGFNNMKDEVEKENNIRNALISLNSDFSSEYKTEFSIKRENRENVLNFNISNYKLYSKTPNLIDIFNVINENLKRNKIDIASKIEFNGDNNTLLDINELEQNNELRQQLEQAKSHNDLLKIIKDYKNNNIIKDQIKEKIKKEEEEKNKVIKNYKQILQNELVYNRMEAKNFVKYLDTIMNLDTSDKYKFCLFDMNKIDDWDKFCKWFNTIYDYLHKIFGNNNSQNTFNEKITIYYQENDDKIEFSTYMHSKKDLENVINQILSKQKEKLSDLNDILYEKYGIKVVWKHKIKKNKFLKFDVDDNIYKKRGIAPYFILNEVYKSLKDNGYNIEEKRWLQEPSNFKALLDNIYEDILPIISSNDSDIIKDIKDNILSRSKESKVVIQILFNIIENCQKNLNKDFIKAKENQLTPQNVENLNQFLLKMIDFEKKNKDYDLADFSLYFCINDIENDIKNKNDKYLNMLYKFIIKTTKYFYGQNEINNKDDIMNNHNIIIDNREQNNKINFINNNKINKKNSENNINDNYKINDNINQQKCNWLQKPDNFKNLLDHMYDIVTIMNLNFNSNDNELINDFKRGVNNNINESEDIINFLFDIVKNCQKNSKKNQLTLENVENLNQFLLNVIENEEYFVFSYIEEIIKSIKSKQSDKYLNMLYEFVIKITNYFEDQEKKQKEKIKKEEEEKNKVIKNYKQILQNGAMYNRIKIKDLSKYLNAIINFNDSGKCKLCLFDMTKIDNWDNLYKWVNEISNNFNEFGSYIFDKKFEIYYIDENGKSKNIQISFLPAVLSQSYIQPKDILDSIKKNIAQKRLRERFKKIQKNTRINKIHEIHEISPKLKEELKKTEKKKQITKYIDIFNSMNKNISFSKFDLSSSNLCISINTENNFKYNEIDKFIDSLKSAIKLLHDCNIQIDNLKEYTIDFIFPYHHMVYVDAPNDFNLEKEYARRIIKKANELKEYIENTKRCNPNMPKFKVSNIGILYTTKDIIEEIDLEDFCKKIREQYPYIENEKAEIQYLKNNFKKLKEQPDYLNFVRNNLDINKNIKQNIFSIFKNEDQSYQITVEKFDAKIDDQGVLQCTFIFKISTDGKNVSSIYEIYKKVKNELKKEKKEKILEEIFRSISSYLRGTTEKIKKYFKDRLKVNDIKLNSKFENNIEERSNLDPAIKADYEFDDFILLYTEYGESIPQMDKDAMNNIVKNFSKFIKNNSNILQSPLYNIKLCHTISRDDEYDKLDVWPIEALKGDIDIFKNN